MVGSVEATYLDLRADPAPDRARLSNPDATGSCAGGLLAACTGACPRREHHRVRCEPCADDWMSVVHRGIGQGLR